MTGRIGCPDCGAPIARQCAAHITRARGGRAAGHRCHHPAVRGAVVCGSHGGAAPQVRAAAARRVAEEAAMAVWERQSRNGEHASVDVLAELLLLARRVAAFTDFAEARLAELPAADWAAFGPATEAQVRMFTRAVHEARKLLVDMARLGLDERAAERFAAAYWRRVAGQASDTVERILRRLGHASPRQDAAVAAVVREEFARTDWPAG